MASPQNPHSRRKSSRTQAGKAAKTQTVADPIFEFAERLALPVADRRKVERRMRRRQAFFDDPDDRVSPAIKAHISALERVVQTAAAIGTAWRDERLEERLRYLKDFARRSYRIGRSRIAFKSFQFWQGEFIAIGLSELIATARAQEAARIEINDVPFGITDPEQSDVESRIGTRGRPTAAVRTAEQIVAPYLRYFSSRRMRQHIEAANGIPRAAVVLATALRRKYGLDEEQERKVCRQLKRGKATVQSLALLFACFEIGVAPGTIRARLRDGK